MVIGLGTSGTDILIELRRLIFDEFGEAGLPVVSLTAIETNNKKSTYDNRISVDFNKQYQKIDIITAGIESTNELKSWIREGNKEYLPGLAEWLDSRILDFRHFKDGASHIRMAGRLCLWSKWSDIEKKFSSKLLSLSAKENINRTNQILTGRYLRLGLPVPDQLVSKQPLVFIVGTFCGGTCGGMFCDVAYMMKRIMENTGIEPQIRGIFTIMDKFLGSKDEFRNNARNCFTSLWELDHFLRRSGENQPYSVRPYPADTQRELRDSEPPFEFVQILSPSGMSNTSGFINEKGEIRPDPLNLMVAFNLFLDIGSGTGAMKSEIVTNIRDNENFMCVPENGVGHVQAFSTFGLSAIWYPHYKIINAVAAQLALALIDKWLAGRDSDTSNHPSLDLTELFPAIPFESSFKGALVKQKNNLIEMDMDDLIQTLQSEFPDKNSNAFMVLEKGGEVDRYLENERTAFNNKAKSKIEIYLQNLVNALAANLDNVESLMNALKQQDEDLKKTISQLPDNPPSIRKDNEEMSAIEEAFDLVEHDRWLGLLGLKRMASKRYVRKYREVYENYIMEIIKTWKKYHYRKVLEFMRSQLGIDYNTRFLHMSTMRPISDTLGDLQQKLSELRNPAVAKIGLYKKDMDNPCIQMVTIDQSFEDEVDSQSSKWRAQFVAEDYQQTVVELYSYYKCKTLKEFLEDEPSTVVDKITAFFSSKIISHMDTTVDPAVLARLKLSPETLRNLLIDQSQPMLQYQATLIGNYPKLIIGPNKNTLNDLTLTLDLQEIKPLESEYRTFLAVYREIGPIAFDQLSVYEDFRAILDSFIRKEGKLPYFTDKRGFPKPLPSDDIFFRWVDFARRFVKNLDIFSSPDTSKIIYSYKDSSGMVNSVAVDKDNNEFIEFMQSRANRQMFTESVQAACIRMGMKDVSEMINREITSFENRIVDDPFKSVAADLRTCFNEIFNRNTDDA